MTSQSIAQIPYGRQSIDEADVEAVVAVLRSDLLTQGPMVPAFEHAVAEYCGVDYGVATNSATSALHVACLALGLGPGDVAWTSAITFVASANCILYCGASVDFVDINPNTFNMCADALEEKLLKAQAIGKLPKIVIPVHMAGQPCEMKRIFELSRRFGFKIIEDGSHAIGAKYFGEPVGRCCFSDITIFSFHPVKIITAGEGGVAVTNEPALAATMRKLRSHGIALKESGELVAQPENEIWNYQQLMLGFNYRMTDIHAALGLSQLQKLDKFVSTRRLIAKRYDEELADTEWLLPLKDANVESSYHLYVVRCDAQRNQIYIYNELRRMGISANLHYIPVYRHPYYQKQGFNKYYCSNAEKYFTSALSLPIYAGLNYDEQGFVIEALRQVAVNLKS